MEVFQGVRREAEAEILSNVVISSAYVVRKEIIVGGDRVRKKITFFGHFGQGNFGNESTLQAILHNLRRFLRDAEVNCITSGPEGTAAIHNIEAITIADILVKSWRPRNPLGRLT